MEALHSSSGSPTAKTNANHCFKSEADPSQGRVSNESAVGKALLGRRVGDLARVETDGGDSYHLKVVGIA